MSHSDFNNCTFIGRLPEMPRSTVTSQNVEISNFAILTNYVYTDKSGAEVKKPVRVHCVAFRGLAHVINEHARTGRRVLVSGRMDVDKVTSDNVTRYYTKIVVDTFQFLDNKDSFLQTPEVETVPDTVVEL